MQLLKLLFLTRLTLIVKSPAFWIVLIISQTTSNALTQESFRNVPSALIEELVQKFSNNNVSDNVEISALQIRIPSRLEEADIKNWVAICKRVINGENIKFSNPNDVADDYDITTDLEIVDEINHMLQDIEDTMFMKRYVRLMNEFYRVDQTVYTKNLPISSSFLFDDFSYTLCNSVDNKNGELYSWEVHNNNNNAIIYADNKHQLGADPLLQVAFPSSSELLFHLKVSLFNEVNPDRIDRKKLSLLADGAHNLLELKYRELSRNNKPMIEFWARVLIEGDKYFSGRSTKIICDVNLSKVYEEKVFLEGENLPIRYIQRADFDDQNIPGVYSVFDKQQNLKSKTDIFICLSWNKNVNFNSNIFEFNPPDNYVLTDRSGGGNKVLKLPEVTGINPEFVQEGMRNVFDKSHSKNSKSNIPRVAILILLVVSIVIFVRVRNKTGNMQSNK